MRGAAGATLVEYALVLAVFLVPTIAGISYLTTQSSREANSQADCVSRRPPPPSCQARAITTSTSTTAPPPTTTTTVPGPTTTTTSTTTPPTTAPRVGAATWDTAGSTFNRTSRVLTMRVNIRTSPGDLPVPGAVVTFGVRITPGGQTFAATCTATSTGLCTATFDVPAGVTVVEGAIVRVDSDPATPTLPDTTITWNT